MRMTFARAVAVFVALLVSAPAVAEALFSTFLIAVIDGEPVFDAERERHPGPDFLDDDRSGTLGGGAFRAAGRVSEDARGLHAFAFINTNGIDGNTFASAEILDNLHFAGSGSAIAHATITTNGSTSGSASGSTRLSLGSDFGGCTFGGAGSCTESITFDLASGFLLDMELIAIANGVGRADFDTAFISSLFFTDLAGNLLDLTYTADSGFTYPMTPIPEPASLALSSVGLAALGLCARRRARARAGRCVASWRRLASRSRIRGGAYCG